MFLYISLSNATKEFFIYLIYLDLFFLFYFAIVALDAKLIVCCIFFCDAIRMEKLALVISYTDT